jgi:hypothetical protein
MSKYIYKIIPKVPHEEKEIYIGSTKQPLSIRLSKHKHDYKRFLNGRYRYVSSFYLFNKYGVNDCEIIELEKINSDITNTDLRKLEYIYIQDLECVNIHGKHRL